MSLTLAWSDEQETYPVKETLIEKLEMILQLAGEEEQLTEGDVSLTFVDDERIHQLNKQYRGIDRPTDVLSFAMQETGEGEMDIRYDEEDFVVEELTDEDSEEAADTDEADELDEDYPEPLGDIIISVPRAVAQAQDYGHSLERELCFLFVHGFLHLLGYDHEDEESEKAMFTKQEMILQKAGITR